MKSLFSTPKKVIILVICAVVVIVAASVITVKSTLITKAEATTVALRDAGLSEAEASALRTRLEFDDGRFQYEVDFYNNGTEYEYLIQAKNGDIIARDIDSGRNGNNDVQDLPQDTGNQFASNGNSPMQPQESVGNQPDKEGDSTVQSQEVSLDGAKAAALKDAGLPESDVTFKKAELDYDHETQVYDIEFYTSDTEYEYEIDASSGTVHEKNIEQFQIQTNPTDSTKTENIINEEEEDFIPNTKESNENQKFEYSIELSSIPTLQSSSKNIDPSNNENEINGSTKAKRLTTEEVNAIQKKVFGNLGYEGETETENETENYIKFENKNEKDIVENDFKNYRKKKPTSAFMFSQNDYSYSEIDSENNHKNNDINNHNCEEEKIENEKEKESENDNENTLEKEKESENDNENTLENEDEIDNNNESIKDNNNDEESFINTELTEAISNKNFSSQVIHDLVHYVTGVPKHVSKNRNLNGSLNNSGNLNNTSMIDNEDKIFAFQERFVSIIEVEILTNEGETINIFPTNLNDYLIDRNTFLNEEKKEKEVKSIPAKHIVFTK